MSLGVKGKFPASCRVIGRRRERKRKYPKRETVSSSRILPSLLNYGEFCNCCFGSSLKSEAVSKALLTDYAYSGW